MAHITTLLLNHPLISNYQSYKTNKQLPQEPRRKEPLEKLEQGCPIELVHVSDRKTIEHK